MALKPAGMAWLTYMQIKSFGSMATDLFCQQEAHPGSGQSHDTGPAQAAASALNLFTPSRMTR